MNTERIYRERVERQKLLDIFLFSSFAREELDSCQLVYSLHQFLLFLKGNEVELVRVNK